MMAPFVDAHGFPTPIGSVTVLGAVLATVSIAKRPITLAALTQSVLNELDLDDCNGMPLVCEALILLARHHMVHFSGWDGVDPSFRCTKTSKVRPAATISRYAHRQHIVGVAA